MNNAQLQDTTTRVTWTLVAVTLVVLVLHLWVAGHLEFMFDEAYYTLWSRHLAWGYYDHPPGIAAWIWLSSTIFGTSEWGVRALGIFATAVGTLAVYMIGIDLFAERRTAALAGLLWNACPLIGVGAILVTPDSPLLFGWTMALWALGRLYRTDDWRWWMIVGLGAGLALEAKYSALFLGPAIVLAMLVVPRLRHWWGHPAPYAGGILALALFAPNILWNARHGWQTFAKQFGRIAEVEWTLRFVGELIGSQVGLLGPLTFVLAVAGVALAFRAPTDERTGARRLLVSSIAPLIVFFLIHSLHDRVQGNWVAPLYPAFVLLAADAVSTPITTAVWAARLLAVARDWAVPSGLGLTALIYVQALLAPVPLPPQADPTALLTGWRQLAVDLEDVAVAQHAGYVLTQGYALASLLKVYSPSGRPIHQFTERQRWLSDPTENQPVLASPGLYIVEDKRAGSEALAERFGEISVIAYLERHGNGRVIERYTVYRLARPTAPILDPPPE